MKAVVTIVLLVGLAATPALADMEGGHRHGGWLHRMDLNGDGKVSAAEADAVRTVMFLRWDLDGDGAVTEEEMIERWTARIKRRVAIRFEKHDANGDGRIERAEFTDSASARFSALDADGDGVLSGDELRALRHGGHGRHRRQHGDPGG